MSDQAKPATPATLEHALAWMLAQLDDAARRELLHRLLVIVNPDESAAQRRAKELGPLASMLNGQPPSNGLEFRLIERQAYDNQKPASALAAQTLVRRYGSWPAVCSRAYQLRPDGTYDRKRRRWRLNQPWPQWVRGRHMPPPYSRDEVLAAIRACAESLGRPPSGTAYVHWSAQKRRRARGYGIFLRLPSMDAILRHFRPSDGGFPAARREALSRANHDEEPEDEHDDDDPEEHQ
jgi:hypothetical protein